MAYAYCTIDFENNRAFVNAIHAKRPEHLEYPEEWVEIIYDEIADSPQREGGDEVAGILSYDYFDLTIDFATKVKRSEIDQALQYFLKEQGAYFDGHFFEVNEGSMSLLNASFTIAKEYEKLMGEGSWQGTYWTDRENKLYKIENLSNMSNMIVHLGAQGANYYSIWQTLKNKVSLITDLKEILSFNVTEEWLK